MFIWPLRIVAQSMLPVLALALATSSIAVSVALAEKVPISSTSPATPTEIIQRQGAAATVSGEFTLPAGAKGPVPAMILKHGSGGLEGPTGANITKWARTLNGWGIATLIVDSFGPRNIRNTATDQAQLSQWTDTADALAALKMLGADPRIDRQRIGIMGWSRGGSVAINTAFERIRKGVISDDLKFAAHVVIYGSASVQYRGDTDKSPFLFIHGEADDYVPIGPVREFAAWAESAGHAVSVVPYPGAFHLFDVEGTPQGLEKNLETISKCDVVIDLTKGRVTRVDRKEATSQGGINAYLESCRTKGANLAYNAKARADSVAKVEHFLKASLRIGN
jgi:dienelactone hydrolase